MTAQPFAESIEEPEQRSASTPSSSGLTEVNAAALQKQKAQQAAVMPCAPPVILWRPLMLEQ